MSTTVEDDRAPWEDAPVDSNTEVMEAASPTQDDIELQLPDMGDTGEVDEEPQGPYSDYGVNQAYKLITTGRNGLGAWIPLQNLPRLGKELEIARATYYLLGGASGTGKTAFAHQQFILAPYLWYKQNKENTNIQLEIIVRNMERPISMLIAKWVCVYLLQKYKILTDVRYITGRGQRKAYVSDEIFEKIKEGFKFFDEMMDVVTIISGGENPTGIWNQVKKTAKANGRIIEREGASWRYIPNNPNKITLLIVDHIGRIKSERGYSDVQNLGKMSEYLSEARDIFGFSPVVVCQFNRGLQETSRRTSSKMNLYPEERDFKGASDMYEDCDVAMALFNPWKYQLEEALGYRIPEFVSTEGSNRFRSLHVLKNSWGTDDFSTGLQFIGEAGVFAQLPLANQMQAAHYAQYANPHLTKLQ